MNRAIAQLADMGVVSAVDRRARDRLFTAHDVIALFETPSRRQADRGRTTPTA